MFFFSFISFSQTDKIKVKIDFKRNNMFLVIENQSNEYVTFFDKKIVRIQKKNKVFYELNSASIKHESGLEIINLSKNLYPEEYFVKAIDLHLRRGRYVNKYIEPKEIIVYKINIKNTYKKNQKKIILSIDNQEKEFVFK